MKYLNIKIETIKSLEKKKKQQRVQILEILDQATVLRYDTNCTSNKINT